ncbi:hypothetical protein BH10PSE18_BH10PSE18_39690 [soil metagenome]
MNWARVESVWDGVQIAVFIVMAGIAFGMFYGWLIGVGVAAAAPALLFGLNRAANAIVRKSQETKIPQRRFPGPRK